MMAAFVLHKDDVRLHMDDVCIWTMCNGLPVHVTVQTAAQASAECDYTTGRPSRVLSAVQTDSFSSTIQDWRNHRSEAHTLWVMIRNVPTQPNILVRRTDA